VAGNSIPLKIQHRVHRLFLAGEYTHANIIHHITRLNGIDIPPQHINGFSQVKRIMAMTILNGPYIG
jgi:hypothetical protein